MSIVCSTEACPVILNSTCVFYQGETLVYTGIYDGENLQTALQKIDAKFQDAGLGYVFTDGLDQPSPGYPVGLGGELTKDIDITGNYKLSFAGRLGASQFIKTGGLASQFLKADGSVDNTSYQPAGNYISSLLGDVVASGPGAASASLAIVNTNPGTYGSNVRVPIITVDTKGRITNVTSTALSFPSGIISLIGDVSGSGATGTDVVVTLDTVNANTYVGNNLLKFGVDGKGRVTSASPINYNDIVGVLGFDPVPTTRTITINGVAQNLNQNRSWNVGSVTGVTANAGYGISVAVTNPTTTPQINITNTAPDQIVQLLAGAGIQVTGTYPNFTIRALNPISTAGGELSGTYPNPILVNSAVISKVLSGLNITGGTVQSTDDILTAIGKLQNQINGLIGGSIYQGVWNAATNTPTLTSGVGVKGHYYITEVYGTTNLDGINEWHVGDWAIFDGTEWQKVDNTDAVISVNGHTGDVNLITSDIPESGNLYFTTDRARTSLAAGVGLSYDSATGIFTNTISQYTDALARQAISLTTTGNNGTASYDNSTGVLNVPQYTLAGLGGVPTSTTLTINGETYDLSANRSWTIAAGVTSFNTRTGAITLISADVTDALGFTPYNSTNPSGYISGITSGMVTGALGFTPYNATNPAGYITGITSGDVTTALGYTPVTNARTLTINGETYDLTANRSWTIAGGVTSFNTRTGAITLTSGDVTGALGYTPYNNTNPSGYITSSASITGTSAGVSTTVAAGSTANLLYATVGDNDFVRIMAGGSSNAGYLEIATADDGTEPIYVRQYTGTFGTLTRTATLLDGSGNTSFPGNISAANLSGTNTGDQTNVSGYSRSLYSPNGATVVAANDAMPSAGQSFIHTLALGPGGNDGHILGMTWANTTTVYGAQIWLDTDPTNRMSIRSRNSSGTWNGWWEVLTEGNISSYAMPYGNWAGSTGMNDQKLYLRTNGDNNHFIWNADDDWEEIRAYSGTGFRVQSTNGYTIATFASGGQDGNELNVAPDAGGNNGLRINAGDCNACYSRIRLRFAGTERMQIHFFSPSWQGSNFTTYSAGAINLAGYNGVTFGPWNNMDGYVASGGNAWFRGNVTAYSDARVKTNIRPIENALQKVLNSRGVIYDRTDIDSKDNIGFIAQELEKNIEQLVITDGDGKKSVQYQNMTAVLTEAIKEQQAKIDKQDKVIEELKSIIDGFTKWG